jgi:hypothetical protein
VGQELVNMRKNNADNGSEQLIKNQERKIIEVLVKQAIDMLFTNDIFLLENDVNERTITHKLAEYIQGAFENWHVDCEYNKNYQNSELLQKNLLLPRNSKKVDIDDLEAKTVYPDIIVHGRGTDSNLLVMEVKKSTSTQSIDFDTLKLHQYKKELHYKYALFLILCCGEDLSKKVEKYQIQWI